MKNLCEDCKYYKVYRDAGEPDMRYCHAAKSFHGLLTYPIKECRYYEKKTEETWESEEE